MHVTVACIVILGDICVSLECCCCHQQRNMCATTSIHTIASHIECNVAFSDTSTTVVTLVECTAAAAIGKHHGESHQWLSSIVVKVACTSRQVLVNMQSSRQAQAEGLSLQCLQSELTVA